MVYDEKGKEQIVTGLSEINYSPESYKVTFCNGEFIIACAEHRWLTYTKLNRKSEVRYPGSQIPTVKTTREIKDSLMWGKEYNHSIPYAKPIEMSEKDLEIDPYLFGCWLGDGATHKAGITSADNFILKQFEEKYGVTHYSKYDYGITGGFLSSLKNLRVLGNKKVPDCYLLNSIENRLALLQGLMDTDGTVNKQGTQCCFDNSNYNLAMAVYYLVASLGMKPILSNRNTKLNGKACKTSWRVKFKATIPVFKLPRKLERLKPSKKSLHHTIISVEPCESVPMRCISVSGESKLYLIGGSLIPTHNTEFSLYTLYRWALTIPNGQFYYIAPFYNQAAELIWKPNRVQNFLYNPEKNIDLRQRYIADIHETDRRVMFKNGSFIKLVGADNYEAGRGFNPDGAVGDEYKDCDYRFFQGFNDNLITKKAPIMLVGTPPDNFDNHFVRTEEEFKLDPRGAYFKMPTYMNPYIDKEELEMEKKAAEMKGEVPKFMREIMAEIVPGGAFSIFPMFKSPMVDAAGKFTGETDHVKKSDKLDERIRRHPKDYNFYCAFDPGSSICFGVLFMAVNKYTKQVLILDEIYEKNRNETTGKKIWPRAAKIMQRYAPIEKWMKVYDYAASWFQVEINNEFGVALMPCTKDVNKKDVALSVIKDFMLATDLDNESLFLVADRCEKFIWEAANYATDEEGRIPKVNDHLIDALRYDFNAAGLSTVPRERRSRSEDVREWSREDWMDEEELEVLDFHEELTEEFWE